MNDVSASLMLPRTFFVCHSSDGALSVGQTTGVHLWTGNHLAEVAVKSGLFDWLMDQMGDDGEWRQNQLFLARVDF